MEIFSSLKQVLVIFSNDITKYIFAPYNELLVTIFPMEYMILATLSSFIDFSEATALLLLGSCVSQCSERL